MKKWEFKWYLSGMTSDYSQWIRLLACLANNIDNCFAFLFLGWLAFTWTWWWRRRWRGTDCFNARADLRFWYYSRDFLCDLFTSTSLLFLAVQFFILPKLTHFFVVSLFFESRQINVLLFFLLRQVVPFQRRQFSEFCTGALIMLLFELGHFFFEEKYIRWYWGFGKERIFLF